jgi:hypothetical protein
MAKPVWGLYDNDEKLVATIRADSAQEARKLFRSFLEYSDLMKGRRVKKCLEG